MWSMMSDCHLCPRNCGVNRLLGETGVCGVDSRLMISSYSPHFGEERPLVGRHGSGTIFMTHCNLRCVFCINGDISISGGGRIHSIEEMAAIMIQLQEIGCHNINIVTPTHYAPHLLLALDIAADRGLDLPLVYNTSGYEHTEILKMLDGVVDIYLPDIKYSDGLVAGKYSDGANDYPEVARKALLEMNRQVGVAIPDIEGIMRRGLMIRHLVMPGKVSGSVETLDWIASNLPKDTYINLMSQYRPMHNAFSYPEISRSISREEYLTAVRHGEALGLSNIDIQG